MTATITAVQADPGAASPVGTTTESALQDVIASLQNGAISNPQLASPAALASELFSNLRGYFERKHNLQKALRSEEAALAGNQSRGTFGADGVQLAALSEPDQRQVTRLHGGPARESLEADGTMLPTITVTPADLGRLSELLLASAELSNQELIVAQELFQVLRSVNMLLKGQ